jgi:hypothetical protein
MSVCIQALIKMLHKTNTGVEKKFALFCKVTISSMFHCWVEQVVFFFIFCVLVQGEFRNEAQMPCSKYTRWRKKNVHVVFKFVCCRKGWGLEEVTPPPLPLFPGWSVDISLRDDLTVILLLGVSFMPKAEAVSGDYWEGWSLPTVETEVNGDSKSTNKGVLSWFVRWACLAGTRDIFSALAALIGPVDTI